MEGRIVALFARTAGLGLALLAAAGWLSLISWSAQDPSLTHAASGLTRNWLGPLGAIVSDLLLQTLGFVAIFAPLGLAFGGTELLLSERMTSAKLRVMFYPLALVVLAGALSSVPVPSNWPLNHGLGGIVGDAAFNALAGLFGLINPARAGAAAGLVMFAGGMCLMSTVLGLSQREWAVLVQPGRSGHQSQRFAQWFGMSPPVAAAAGPSYAEPSQPVPYPDPHWQGSAASHAAAPMPPPMSFDIRPGDMRPGEMQHRHGAPYNQVPPAHSLPGAAPQSFGSNRESDPVFDRSTDRESRAIAARFAPPAQDGTPRRNATERLGGLLSFRSTTTEAAYRRPSLNILKRPAAARPGPEFTQPVLRGNARLLEDVLNDFGIKGEVKDIRPGPVVTLFEMEPARGTKSSRVIALSDDIARSMSAVSARVAIVPGRNAIGIELPNVRRETVYLRELLETEAWRATDAQLPVVLGKGIGGEPVIADLARMPHLLVAGTTGSGKSVGVNAMILSLLYRHSPEECRMLMIDPKMLELSVYNGIPHLLAPVVTDPHRAAAALNWAVVEMEERYKRMSQLGVRNIEIYNTRVKNAKKRGELMGRTVQTGFDERTGEATYVKEQQAHEPMPYIVIVVDEFADLMVVAGKEVEGSVQRLAQMARAAGIHLIMATQRPSVDVVTGTIKANFPTRIAFKVASKIDSRTILNDQGAEQLLGAGDMLYSAGSGQIVRVHGPFVSDEEVERVAAALREQGEPAYVDSLMHMSEAGEGLAGPAAGASTEPDGDDLFDRAVAIVHRDQKASTSYLQRRLSIGYNRAADLIERMEREGLVSPADNVGRRRILMGGADQD